MSEPGVINDSGRKETQEFERLKLAVDSVKHITNLATGTIVLLATFGDKLPKPLAFRGYLVAGAISMVICLIASFIYLWAETLAGPSGAVLGLTIPRGIGRLPRFSRSRFFGILSDTIYLSFCFGILMLARFAIQNI